MPKKSFCFPGHQLTGILACNSPGKLWPVGDLCLLHECRVRQDEDEDNGGVPLNLQFLALVET